MKLLIITAVKAFEKDVRKILEQNGVVTFSYSPVVGYRDSTREALRDNWFATEMNKVESLLFFAFVNAETSDKVFEDVEAHNETCSLESRLHIVVSPVEKYNTLKK